MKSARWLGFAALMGLLFLSGCATGDGEKGAMKGVSRNQADQLNSDRDFETAKDPAFTVKTYYSAGQLAESQKAYPNAVEQYRAALKLDPHHLPSLYRLGVVCAMMRNYPEAITAWKAYIKQTNGDAAAYSNLGFCYELSGQTEEAEKAYQQGIARDARNSACHVNYGLMLARQGRIGEATQRLRAVLSEAQVHYNLGSVHEQQGRREQAKAEYRKALELDANLTDAQSRLTALK